MRASFLGCPIDILTMAETIELARDAMRARRRLQHVALNVAKFVNMRFDPVLAADVANSDVISIDGMGIVWGARALGLQVKTRVAGVDLLGELLATCAREGFKPYFLGATPAVLQQAEPDKGVVRVQKIESGRNESLTVYGREQINAVCHRSPGVPFLVVCHLRATLFE